MKVVITRTLPGAAIDSIRAAGHEVWVFSGPEAIPRDLLLQQASDADALLPLLTEQIDEALLEGAPRLKVVANYAVGFDNIDLEACRRRGIVATHTPDVLTEATADQAWALLLGTARRIVEGHKLTESGQFTAWRPGLLLGRSVHGATLGIIGAGRIGRAVARRASGFSMRILYTSRSDWSEGEESLGAQRVSLEALLAESDFVSLHLPLGPETRQIIRRETLEKMKPTSILVNTSRGGLVHEGDLHEALEKRRILGAGLDVFDPEPPSPDHPLLHHPRVVLAPHLGSATVAAREAMATLAADNLLAVLSGHPPLTPIP